MASLPDEVRTARLTLRVWRLEDAAALARAIDESRPHLEPWMPWAHHERTVDDTARFIADSRQRWADGAGASYGVFADGEIVGGAVLSARHDERILDIGYWLHVDRVGHGYATELAAGLTDAAFARDDVDAVEIHHDRANARSRAVPERLGFSLVEERPGERITPGDEGVDWVWAVDRAAWTARREGR